MGYIRPEDVHSPKGSWKLKKVIVDKGEWNGAYAIGEWYHEVEEDHPEGWRRRIAFRWNGHGTKPAGNPQSRGNPTWMMLDEDMHAAILDGLARLPEKHRPTEEALADARRFLGLES